jgi:hypothetical protein
MAAKFYTITQVHSKIGISTLTESEMLEGCLQNMIRLLCCYKATKISRSAFEDTLLGFEYLSLFLLHR